MSKKWDDLVYELTTKLAAVDTMQKEVNMRLLIVGDKCVEAQKRIDELATAIREIVEEIGRTDEKRD